MVKIKETIYEIPNEPANDHQCCQTCTGCTPAIQNDEQITNLAFVTMWVTMALIIAFIIALLKLVFD